MATVRVRLRRNYCVPRNHRVVLTGAGSIDYLSVEEFHQEEIKLSLWFQQLEEYYAIYRC